MTTITQERAGLQRVGRPLRQRQQWGSTFNYTTSNPVDEPANQIYVHITITNPNSYSSNDAHVRAVEAIGKSRFPNTGGSYNRVHTPDGTAYELQPIGRRGAHTVNTFQRSTCTTSGCPSRGRTIAAPGRNWNLNYNARAYAIAQNVNNVVSAKLVDSVARSIAADILAGFIVKGSPIHGHRCVTAKSCPANPMWAQMARLEQLVDYYVANGFKEEDDMPTQAEFNAWLDAYYLDRLKASEFDPNAGQPHSMSAVKKAFTVAPWHQALGSQAGQDPQHPLVNMHKVMSDIYWTLQSGILDKILVASLEDNADIDEEALANLLAPMINSKVTAVSDQDLERIAEAVANEQYRRQAPDVEPTNP